MNPIIVFERAPTSREGGASLCGRMLEMIGCGKKVTAGRSAFPETALVKDLRHASRLFCGSAAEQVPGVGRRRLNPPA